MKPNKLPIATTEPSLDVSGLGHEPQVEADEINWEAYAEFYDEMCALNPAYQHNVEMLLERLDSWGLPKNSSVCDLGAGTGNYILGVSSVLPSAAFWHVDSDQRMIESARKKYLNAKLNGVNILQSDVHNVQFPEDSFDLIICVNALYAFASQAAVLTKMRSWLKNNGRLFVIDMGRRQRTLDWTLYMFREAIKSRQLRRYTRTLIEGRELLKQNRRTTRGQESGRYWLHSTDEFGDALRNAGLKVEELGHCYRNYADFAVCMK